MQSLVQQHFNQNEQQNTHKNTFAWCGLLTRFAFKGDKEEFSGPWTQIRPKNPTIDKKLAGSQVLAFIQYFLEQRAKSIGLKTRHEAIQQWEHLVVLCSIQVKITPSQLFDYEHVRNFRITGFKPHLLSHGQVYGNVFITAMPKAT